MSPPPQTPPTYPTNNVHLSNTKIEAILKATLPDYDVYYIHELDCSKSYNNRIYLIDVQPAHEDSQTEDREGRNLLLKVSGRYFDHRKVENEVAGLLLLKKYCPEIPVPDVLAWPTSGGTIETIAGESIEAEQHDAVSEHGWILMTRLPGRVLTIADLDSEHGTGILKRLAQYVTTWRRNIPAQSHSGNLCLDKDGDSEQGFQDLLPNRTFTLNGSLLFKNLTNSKLPYHQVMAQDQLSHLKQDSRLNHLNSHLGQEIETWI